MECGSWDGGTVERVLAGRAARAGQKGTEDCRVAVVASVVAWIRVGHWAWLGVSSLSETSASRDRSQGLF